MKHKLNIQNLNCCCLKRKRVNKIITALLQCMHPYDYTITVDNNLSDTLLLYMNFRCNENINLKNKFDFVNGVN